MIANPTIFFNIRKEGAVTPPFLIINAGGMRMTDISIHYDGPIVTRKEAKELGLKRYFTGIACVHGHMSEKQVTNKTCIVCSYKLSNSSLSKFKPVYDDEYKAKRKAYRQSDKGKIIEADRKRRWKEKNPERDRNHQKDFLKRFPEKAKMYSKAGSSNRRVRLILTEGTYNINDIKFLLLKQKNKCVYCKKDVSNKYHVDHIMPLALGGRNDRKNLQITCPTCNLRKSAKHPLDFARKLGLLI